MESIGPGLAPDQVERIVGATFAREAYEYAVILLDPQLRIASWNVGAEHMLGYPPQEAIGQPVENLFVPEDRARRVPEHEAEIARVAGRALDDRWHVRRDGSRLWVSGVLMALRGADGRLAGFAKIMRDRTDLRTQIDTLKNRLAAQFDEQQRTTAILASLAHELRNPLAPLVNAAHLIRRTADGPQLQYPLQVIDRQIAFLQRLIDDLLDFTRAGTGKLRLAYDRFVLQDLLGEAIASAQPAAQARQQRMQAVLPPTPIEIDADRDRVLQIVMNLLNNAVRYTPPGGRIWLKATTEGAYAVVRVEDDGQGIAPELQPRIFDLFTQGRIEPQEHNEGLGIGLALVKELVAAHGGTVAVRSEGVGKGSEFTVRLPLLPTPLLPPG